MSFLTQLDPPSGSRLEKLMQAHLLGPGTSLKVHSPRRDHACWLPWAVLPACCGNLLGQCSGLVESAWGSPLACLPFSQCNIFNCPIQVLLRAPPAPPGPDHVLFDQFWVGTGGGPLPAPGEGERHPVGRSGLAAFACLYCGPGYVDVCLNVIGFYTPFHRWRRRRVCADPHRARPPAQPGARSAAAALPHPAPGTCSDVSMLGWAVQGQTKALAWCSAARSHCRLLSAAFHPGRHALSHLQGPTSSGKTSLVAYLAAQTGHTFVRINNHEQTDLQVGGWWPAVASGVGRCAAMRKVPLVSSLPVP